MIYDLISSESLVVDLWHLGPPNLVAMVTALGSSCHSNSLIQVLSLYHSACQESHRRLFKENWNNKHDIDYRSSLVSFILCGRCMIFTFLQLKLMWYRPSSPFMIVLSLFALESWIHILYSLQTTIPVCSPIIGSLWFSHSTPRHGKHHNTN